MSEFSKKAHFAPRTIALKLALVIAAGILVGGPAWGAGEREAGWNLARRWCAGCHVVDMSGYGADTAASFPTIARERGKDQGWLRAWLNSPHPPMPNMHLSRAEIDDVIAYLESLTRP
jgi:cytochrome c